MTKLDMPKLARVLAMLSDTFNESFSDMRAEGYFIGLSDLTIEQVEAGARQALKLSKFFPRPAEIREYAVGSSGDKAEQSWLEVLREVRRVGGYGVPVLDPVTQDTVRAVWGTWGHLCSTLPADGAELLGWSKRFKAAYAIGQKERTLLANYGLLDA